MSSKRLVRVTCTLPADLVLAADAAAAREGRSRSWVVAEALRKLNAEAIAVPPSAERVREPLRHPYDPAFDDARRQLLLADLALTPEERVRIVDELARTAIKAHPQPRFERLLAFDSWEDFFAWKKADVLP